MYTSKRFLWCRIIFATIFICFVFAGFSLISFASDVNDENCGFAASANNTKYTAEEIVESLPKTYEFTISVPEDHSEGSIVFSTKNSAAEPFYNVAINGVGAPSFSVGEGVGISKNFVFDEVDLRGFGWTRVSIVISDAGEVLCYVNGELKSQKTAEIADDLVLTTPLIVGGSYLYNSFFTGEIKTLAISADARCSAEIASGYALMSDEALLCHYDFADVDNLNLPENIPDLSQKNNELNRYSDFYDEPKREVGDYAYSFAIVGDIQIVTERYPEDLSKIYDWIIDNKEEKKIAFVSTLGDLTNSNTRQEWETVDRVLHTLDGVIPYSVVRGNHDKNVDRYKEFFVYEENENCLRGSYDGTMMNTYQTFTVAGNNYLFLNLDFVLDYWILDWANRVVEEHPDHNVIITIHTYLKGDGTTLKRNEKLNPTRYNSKYDCEELWDKLVSRHKNIEMIISGHIGTQAVVTSQRKGVHGNTVTQILLDQQGVDGYYDGGVGIVTMMYFSEDGKIVNTQLYSTLKEKYFIEHNERQIFLDPIQSNGHAEAFHNIEDDLYYNVAVHWNECACGAKDNFLEHTFEWTVTKEATEETDGERVGRCICGHEVTESYKFTPNDSDNKVDRGLIIIIVSALLLVAAAVVTILFLVKKRVSGKKVDENAQKDINEDGNSTEPESDSGESV